MNMVDYSIQDNLFISLVTPLPEGTNQDLPLARGSDKSNPLKEIESAGRIGGTKFPRVETLRHQGGKVEHPR